MRVSHTHLQHRPLLCGTIAVIQILHVDLERSAHLLTLSSQGT